MPGKRAKCRDWRRRCQAWKPRLGNCWRVDRLPWAPKTSSGYVPLLQRHSLFRPRTAASVCGIQRPSRAVPGLVSPLVWSDWPGAWPAGCCGRRCGCRRLDAYPSAWHPENRRESRLLGAREQCISSSWRQMDDHARARFPPRRHAEQDSSLGLDPIASPERRWTGDFDVVLRA